MTGIRHVAVAGRDAAAWLTALALRRAFGPVGVRVTVVELPSLLQPVDVYPALPSLAGLHRLIGVDEAELVRACSAVPVTGQRFSGWSGGDESFVHGYDTQRVAIDDLEFLHFWVKARAQGLRVAYEDFSPAAAAAKQGRIGRSDSDPASLGALQHGYHLDALSYVALIRRHALRAGVVRRDGFGGVDQEGDRIAALRLEDGTPIEADLYVDASGAEAVLHAALRSEFESWASWLPVDRILVASAAPLRPLPAFAQVSAAGFGWVALHPLQERTAIVAGYRSDSSSDEEAFAAAASAAGLTLAGDAVAAAIAPGARTRPWIGNCVAIGEAAVALDPLDAVQLHIVHAGISNLVALFPVDASEMPESTSYCRAIAAHARNLRDFQVAHYQLGGQAGAFWDRARAEAAPASLQARIDLFAARGRVALYDDETFQEQSWAALFVGHGLMPRSYDPQVNKLPPHEQIERFQHLLRVIAGEVRAMPDVAAWLEREQA